MTERKVICGCAICQGDILEGDVMADHKVYDRCDGELDYIELTHLECAKADNDKNQYGYWEFDKCA